MNIEADIENYNLKYLYYSTINNALINNQFFVKVNDGWGGGHVKKLNSFFSAGPGTGGGGGASRSAQEMHCT